MHLRGVLQGRRRWIIAAVLTVLVLLLAGTRTVQVLVVPPEDPVEKLTAALRAKDGPEALKLIGGPRLLSKFSKDDNAHGLFAEKALANGYTPPRMSVGEPSPPNDLFLEESQRPRADMAEVPVHYDLDGRSSTVRVLVGRGESGWVREWEIVGVGVDALRGQIRVPDVYDGTLHIAGAAFRPNSLEDILGEADAPIGTYTVWLEHPLFEPTRERITVRPHNPTLIKIEPSIVRPKITEQVIEQIHDHIDECIEEATELRPQNCPLHYDPGHYFPLQGDAEWTLTENPKVKLRRSRSLDWTDTPVVVETTTPGTATVEYAYKDGEEHKKTVEIDIGGTVTVLDGDVVWKP